MTEGLPRGSDDVWRLLRMLANFRPPLPAVTGQELVVSVRASRFADPQASVGEHPDAVLVSRGIGRVSAQRALPPEALDLFELYAPLCHPGLPRFTERRRARAGTFSVAHLGQSLDGRIAPLSGKPEAITGPEDMTHNHRMRALFDVVLVGAGTICHDDPTLTVRHVDGRNPVRVVVDPDRRLSPEYGVFKDGLAPTLLLCREELCVAGERHGRADVVGVADGCTPAAVLEALAERQLPRVFIEGGGVTVSRFLEAGCLDRLQIAVSPLIMGQGRPGLDLGQTLRLRPTVRRFNLADDVLFECCFDDG
jgi:riboflavin-specific deaminase-like protein